MMNIKVNDCDSLQRGDSAGETWIDSTIGASHVCSCDGCIVQNYGQDGKKKKSLRWSIAVRSLVNMEGYLQQNPLEHISGLE